MSGRFSFTSESVSEGHPDKVADQISDAVLDAILAADPRGRVACETLVKTGVVIVAGEVTTSAWVDVEALVRKTVLDIGYDTSDMGFDGASCGVLNVIGKQSPDIAQGVDRKDERKQGAGDQGLMFGYASNETDVLMPAPITLAHRLVKRQAEVRKNGKLPWLRPDAKSQVTLRYEDNKPVGLEAVVLSTQHSDEVAHPAPARGGHGGDPEARAAGQVDRQAHQVPHQSDRPLRHRRPGRRLRPDRAQDHRRHLRRLRAPRRRRVLRQGSLQGRPLGGLRGALCRQEHRGRGTRAALRGAGLLRHRRRRTHLHHGGDLRDRKALGRAPDADRARAFRPHALRPARDAGSRAADLSENRRLRPFRPQGEGIHLGAHRQGGGARRRTQRKRAPSARSEYRIDRESVNERSRSR